MSDEVVTPGELAAAADDTSTDTGTQNIPADEGGEGATEAEIAAALKSSGIDLKPEAPAEVEPEEEAPEEVEEETPPPPPAPAEPAAKATPPAPVSADTPDFSFTVKDANDVSFKVSPEDSIEDVLADFDPKNNGQIIAVLEQLREAKEAKKAYEDNQTKETAAAETQARIQSIQDGWDAEVKNLQAEKRIPTKDADARISEVYKFMGEINDARIKAGSATVNSFEDALDKLEAKEARDAKVAQDKADKETARKNGGLVGGSSAPASSGTPVYKANSARNANQAIRSLGLL
jgi:hypothetical protein